MKFNNIDFIDFESKNVLTQKTSLVIFMGIFVFGFYTMAVSFVSVLTLILSSDEVVFETAELMKIEWFMILSLFLTIFGIIVSLMYVKFLERRPLKSAGFAKIGFIKQYFSGYFIGIIMISLPALVLALFNGNIVINGSIDYKILILFLFGFMVQGASEEIMLRGYFLTSLAKTTKVTWAILISSGGFALMHILNPGMSILAFVNLALFGIFAAIFFLRTKNIWAICGIHSSWNFFQGNVFGIEVSGQSMDSSVLSVTSRLPEMLTGGAFGLEGGLLVTFVLLTASAIVLFAGKNKLLIKSKESAAVQAA